MRSHRRSPLPPRPPAAAGFTLLEMMFVVFLVGIAAVAFTTFLSTWPSRTDLRRTFTQAQFIASKARLEAIQRGVRTVVEADTTKKTLRAYADVNDNQIFDPTPGLNPRQTDYEIAFFQLERSIFAAPPGEDAIDGFTPPAPEVLVFSPQGVPLDEGAFRFADGDEENHFEVRVLGLTGKIEVRKFLKDDDTPSGNPGSADFFAESRRIDGKNLWVWY